MITEPNPWIPPGSKSGQGELLLPEAQVRVQAVLTDAKAKAAEGKAQAQLKPPTRRQRQVPVARANEDPDWIDASIEIALATLRMHLKTVVENAHVVAGIKEPTCLNCINALETGHCSLFENVPFFVVLAPKLHCPSFRPI